ncbi:MAG: redoxin domain-containing protein [Planctomyces sp.]|nr:redoxin domain-containing protein [Planctomyces sp.]
MPSRSPSISPRNSIGRAVWCGLLLAAVALGPFARPAAAQGRNPGQNPFPGRFTAPELDGGVEWLNTTGPISLRELRGKIVLLDFWTYCCINCIHILPDLKYLEKKYPNELVVIGVHAPKFENERDTENIREAILRYEIEHPVINDANMVIAGKYQFSSWPTLVIIDPEGNFVGQQPGEGTRELFDTVIGRMAAYHKTKGTLDETPVSFVLERQRAEATPLRYPGKLVVDPQGERLFISDSNHNRIVVSSLDGRLLDVIGTGAIGAQDGAYDEATFDHPQGMALVDETLYVADTENHLLREINLTERTVKTLAGTGSQARLRADGGSRRSTALNSPWALAHHDGTLYIAMAGPHQLWSHRIGSNRVDVYAGSGREDIIDGSRMSAALAQPSGITTDGQKLYFVDSEGSAVRSVVIKGAGKVETIAGAHDLPNGRSLFAFGDIDGVGDEARLQHPLGVFHHAGVLFVADTYNHKIKTVDLATRRSETWLGTGRRGAGLDPVELYEPADVLIVGDEALIADTNNHRLLFVNLETRAARELTIEGLEPPHPDILHPPPPPQGELLVLSEQTAKAGGDVTIEVTFQLPDGFKLNPQAPQTCRLIPDGEQSLIPPDEAGVRHEATVEDSTARWTIPTSSTDGAATFELRVAYAYCRDGTGGVCRFGTARWQLPLRLAADAASQVVSLTVQPETN